MANHRLLKLGQKHHFDTTLNLLLESEKGRPDRSLQR